MTSIERSAAHTRENANRASRPDAHLAGGRGSGHDAQPDAAPATRGRAQRRAQPREQLVVEARVRAAYDFRPDPGEQPGAEPADQVRAGPRARARATATAQARLVPCKAASPASGPRGSSRGPYSVSPWPRHRHTAVTPIVLNAGYEWIGPGNRRRGRSRDHARIQPPLRGLHDADRAQRPRRLDRGADRSATGHHRPRSHAPRSERQRDLPPAPRARAHARPAGDHVHREG